MLFQTSLTQVLIDLTCTIDILLSMEMPGKIIEYANNTSLSDIMTYSDLTMFRFSKNFLKLICYRAVLKSVTWFKDSQDDYKTILALNIFPVQQ